jgi:hypothetical protein
MSTNRPAALLLLALIVITQSVAPAAAKPAGSIIGAWNVSLGEDAQSKDESFTMWLEVDGYAVSGTVQFEKYSAKVFDGTWSNGNLSLVMGSSKNKAWYLTLRGTLRPDGSLVGTVEQYDNGKRVTGTFEARR